MRLARHGRKKKPVYSIVIADSRSPRDGKFIEKIGVYDPNTNPASINIDQEQALKWLDNGAQPSETVRAILRYKGILYYRHLQGGVKKGALTEEQMEAKYSEWLNKHEEAMADTIKKLADKAQAAKDAQLAAEKAIFEKKAAEKAKIEADAIAAEEASKAEATAAAAAESGEAEADAPATEEEKAAE